MNNAITYDYVSYGEPSSEDVLSKKESELNPEEKKMKELLAAHGINLEDEESEEEDDDLTDNEDVEAVDKVNELDETLGATLESKKRAKEERRASRRASK